MSSLPHAVTGAQCTLHASHSGKWHRETTLPPCHAPQSVSCRVLSLKSFFPKVGAFLLCLRVSSLLSPRGPRPAICFIPAWVPSGSTALRTEPVGPWEQETWAWSLQHLC